MDFEKKNKYSLYFKISSRKWMQEYIWGFGSRKIYLVLLLRVFLKRRNGYWHYVHQLLWPPWEGAGLCELLLTNRIRRKWWCRARWLPPCPLSVTASALTLERHPSSLWRGPLGKEQASWPTAMCDPSWKWILQPQSSLQINVTQPTSRLQPHETPSENHPAKLLQNFCPTDTVG